MPSPRSGHRAKRRTAPWAALTLLLAAAVTPLSAQTVTKSTLQSIKAVAVRGQAANYDFTLYSTKEFPMKDDVITLTIGTKTFINSRYLQGGTLHTIIFRIPPRDYQLLKNGDPIVVGFGQADPSDSSTRWDFGRLHKPVTGGLR